MFLPPTPPPAPYGLYFIGQSPPHFLFSMNHWTAAGLCYISIPSRVKRSCKCAWVSIGKKKKKVAAPCLKTAQRHTWWISLLPQKERESAVASGRPRWGWNCGASPVKVCLTWADCTCGLKWIQTYRKCNFYNETWLTASPPPHPPTPILLACIERLHNKPLHTQYWSQLTLTKMHYLVIQYVCQVHQL